MQIGEVDACDLRQRDQDSHREKEVARGFHRERGREADPAATGEAGKGVLLLEDEVRDRAVETSQQQSHQESQEFNLHDRRIRARGGGGNPANRLGARRHRSSSAC